MGDNKLDQCWIPFSYSDFETGLFWVLIESPEIDIDVGSDGQLVGVATGKVERTPVLVFIEQDGDLPYFGSLDDPNFGRVQECDVVTHYCEVNAPPVFAHLSD